MINAITLTKHLSLCWWCCSVCLPVIVCVCVSLSVYLCGSVCVSVSMCLYMCTLWLRDQCHGLDQTRVFSSLGQDSNGKIEESTSVAFLTIHMKFQYETFYPFTNLKQRKRPCLGENRPKFAAKRKKLKGGDLRNSGVQLRLVESKGRVSGSGHYGHYGATAIVKSAYNQNTELQRAIFY